MVLFDQQYDGIISKMVLKMFDHQGPGGSYVQAGVVAWGLGCGGDTPGVYAAVSEVAPCM